jgi:hypothetical protein
MSRDLFANQLLKDKHVVKENIVERQACCEEKQETSVHVMTTSSFYIWLGID